MRDFWLFDERVVMGASAGPELDERSESAAFCAAAFEAVWQRATPHEGYRI